MCGLFASNDPLVSLGAESVVDLALKYRGPDTQSGLIEFAGWKLYHSRLAIIAPTKEYSQPFRCADGSMLLFNGEVFNYQELSNRFLGEDLESDTETLARLLLLSDFDIAELDGFFAFVRISQDGEILNCARDHFGVKPLFYFRRYSYLTVSSEPKAIKELFGLEVSENAIEEYRIFRGPMFSGSYFKGVDQVTPGTCLVLGRFFDSSAYIQDRNYRRPDLDEIRASVDASIASRHIADVPVGLLYSGGVDSNLIDRQGPQLVRYSVGFEGDYDLEYAVSAQGEADTRILKVSPEQFRDKFDQLLELRGEPMSVPNEVMLSLVGDLAKSQGIKVLLSGEGADEFFAGYDRIYRWAAGENEFSLLEFCNLYCYSDISAGSREYERLNEVFRGFGNLTCFELVRQFFVKYHLPLLFRRLDFSLMSAGIEGREPLASVRMYKTAMQMGPEELMEGCLGKIPLRELLAIRKGREFAFRKKVGFPVTLSDIFAVDYDKKMSNYQIWYHKNMEMFE